MLILCFSVGYLQRFDLCGLKVQAISDILLNLGRTDRSAPKYLSSPPFYGANIHSSPLERVCTFSHPVCRQYLCLPHSMQAALARMGNIAMVLILISGHIRHDNICGRGDEPPASP